MELFLVLLSNEFINVGLKLELQVSGTLDVNSHARQVKLVVKLSFNHLRVHHLQLLDLDIDRLEPLHNLAINEESQAECLTAKVHIITRLLTHEDACSQARYTERYDELMLSHVVMSALQELEVKNGRCLQDSFFKLVWSLRVHVSIMVDSGHNAGMATGMILLNLHLEDEGQAQVVLTFRLCDFVKDVKGLLFLEQEHILGMLHLVLHGWVDVDGVHLTHEGLIIVVLQVD